MPIGYCKDAKCASSVRVPSSCYSVNIKKGSTQTDHVQCLANYFAIEVNFFQKMLELQACSNWYTPVPPPRVSIIGILAHLGTSIFVSVTTLNQ